MRNVIRNKIWRIFLVSLFTGLIISVVESVSAYFMAKGTNEWTLAMDNIVFWIGIILAVVLFFIAGLFCFRDMSKVEIAKSATIVVLYSIVILTFEQLMLSMGQYSLILPLLFIPARQYTIIHQLLLRFTSASLWIGILPSIMAPYLYIVFEKRQFGIRDHKL